jgi:hypothetical protein
MQIPAWPPIYLMKAIPVRAGDNAWVSCPIEEATHVQIYIPGPTGKLALPFVLKGKREGTGCWTWNGDTEKPTLKPSVKTTNGKWICHSWINDGQAIFLEDSSHELKGQTVDLLDLDTELKNP